MFTLELLAADPANWREARVNIYHDGRFIGRVVCEQRRSVVFVHYSLERDHRRQGLISRALDLVRATFDDVRFCDDPDYQSLGGNGFMTEDGQAFADGYRLKNNIPLPPLMWASAGQYGGRRLINRYEENRLAA